jgi:hypothetical protein
MPPIYVPSFEGVVQPGNGAEVQTGAPLGQEDGLSRPAGDVWSMPSGGSSWLVPVRGSQLSIERAPRGARPGSHRARACRAPLHPALTCGPCSIHTSQGCGLLPAAPRVPNGGRVSTGAAGRLAPPAAAAMTPSKQPQSAALGTVVTPSESGLVDYYSSDDEAACGGAGGRLITARPASSHRGRPPSAGSVARTAPLAPAADTDSENGEEADSDEDGEGAGDGGRTGRSQSLPDVAQRLARLERCVRAQRAPSASRATAGSGAAATAGGAPHTGVPGSPEHTLMRRSIQELRSEVRSAAARGEAEGHLLLARIAALEAALEQQHHLQQAAAAEEADASEGTCGAELLQAPPIMAAAAQLPVSASGSWGALFSGAAADGVYATMATRRSMACLSVRCNTPPTTRPPASPATYAHAGVSPSRCTPPRQRRPGSPGGIALLAGSPSTAGSPAAAAPTTFILSSPGLVPRSVSAAAAAAAGRRATRGSSPEPRLLAAARAYASPAPPAAARPGSPTPGLLESLASQLQQLQRRVDAALAVQGADITHLAAAVGELDDAGRSVAGAVVEVGGALEDLLGRVGLLEEGAAPAECTQQAEAAAAAAAENAGVDEVAHALQRLERRVRAVEEAPAAAAAGPAREAMAALESEASRLAAALVALLQRVGALEGREASPREAKATKDEEALGERVAALLEERLDALVVARVEAALALRGASSEVPGTAVSSAHAPALWALEVEAGVAPVRAAAEEARGIAEAAAAEAARNSAVLIEVAARAERTAAHGAEVERALAARAEDLTVQIQQLGRHVVAVNEGAAAVEDLDALKEAVQKLGAELSAAVAGAAAEAAGAAAAAAEAQASVAEARAQLEEATAKGAAREAVALVAAAAEAELRGEQDEAAATAAVVVAHQATAREVAEAESHAPTQAAGTPSKEANVEPSVAATAGAQAASVAALEDRMSDLERTHQAIILQVTEHVAAAGEKLIVLEADTASAAAALQQGLEDVAKEMATLRADVISQHTPNATFVGEAALLRERVDEVGKEVAGLHANADSRRSTEADAAAGMVAAAALRERVDEMAKEVAALRTAAASRHGMEASAAGAVEAMQQRVDEVAKEVAALRADAASWCRAAAGTANALTALKGLRISQAALAERTVAAEGAAAEAAACVESLAAEQSRHGDRLAQEVADITNMLQVRMTNVRTQSQIQGWTNQVQNGLPNSMASRNSLAAFPTYFKLNEALLAYPATSSRRLLQQPRRERAWAWMPQQPPTS